MPPLPPVMRTWTISWGRATGRLRRRTASSSWKIAVLAPMPRASEAIATRGEADVVAERARRVAQVAGEPIEPADAVHLVDLLADAGEVAQLAAGGVAGVGGRQAARDVVGRLDRRDRLSSSRARSRSQRARASHRGSRIASLLGRPQHLVDRAHEAVPAAGLVFELFAPGRRQAVVARLAVVLGRAPEGAIQPRSSSRCRAG